MLRKPPLNPLERLIPIQNVDLGDQLPTHELVHMVGYLPEARQHSTTQHQDQPTAKDLIILKQIAEISPKLLKHPQLFPLVRKSQTLPTSPPTATLGTSCQSSETGELGAGSITSRIDGAGLHCLP